MDASDFTPRPIRFRVWDGERMLEGEDLLYPESGYPRFLLDAKGKLWRRNADGRTRFAIGCVPLLSTGLTDADGREVFEGDIVEGGGSNDIFAGHVRGVVKRQGMAFVCVGETDTDGGKPWLWTVTRAGATMLRDLRVVGSVFEGIAEPA